MSGQAMWSIVTVVLFAALVMACAEARNPGGGAGGDAGGGGAGGSGATSSTGGGGAAGGTGGTTGTGAGGAASPLVINEIGATGDEFVEIVNPTSKAISLDDLALADTDSTNGEPKIADAARFPKGAEIAPGEHLVVLCGQDPSDGVGPHDKCGADGPDICYYATWSVSAKDGETVFLLSPSDEILAQAEYPADAASTGNTWGRFPDVTGDLAETLATAGKPNELP